MILSHPLLPITAGMAVPPSPKIHSGPAPSARTSIYANCRYMKYWTGQRNAIESWLCIQLDIIIDMTKPPLCSWATGGTAMSSGSKSMSFNNQRIQVAIPMLLLCAPRHFHFCFCSEIRKATSTCNKITALLILCSSTVLYVCFLATKCLCYQDRKVAHDFCIKATYFYQDGTRIFSFNL